jgi:hypothetical protein
MFSLFARLFIPLMVVCVIGFFITQIILPAIRNRPLFPFFRRTGEKRITNAELEINEARLRLEASNLEKQAADLNRLVQEAETPVETTVEKAPTKKKKKSKKVSVNNATKG